MKIILSIISLFFINSLFAQESSSFGFENYAEDDFSILWHEDFKKSYCIQEALPDVTEYPTTGVQHFVRQITCIEPSLASELSGNGFNIKELSKYFVKQTKHAPDTIRHPVFNDNYTFYLHRLVTRLSFKAPDDNTFIIHFNLYRSQISYEWRLSSLYTKFDAYIRCQTQSNYYWDCNFSNVDELVGEFYYRDADDVVHLRAAPSQSINMIKSSHQQQLLLDVTNYINSIF